MRALHLVAGLLFTLSVPFCISVSSNATASALPEPAEFVKRTAVRQERLWRRSSQPIANVTVNKVPLGSLLAPLLDYPFLLPSAQLKAGMGYSGARVRLRRFVRDLLSGHKSMKIGVVGGSISWGQGASVIGTTDWFSVLARWMIDAFPAANIKARNGAVPATPSSYMVMCLEQSVDPDVDLVLVEYGMNDGYEDRVFGNGVVKKMERLLRRLLALPGQPAVIMMQVPMYGMGMYPENNDQHRGFYFTSEDVDASLSHYYDVPYLSLRTALYRLAAFERQEGWLWNQTFTDFHPGDPGFRCMSDLVVHLLQSTAMEMLTTDPWGADDTVTLHRHLPPPMYQGNVAPNSTMCVVGEGFRQVVTSAEGFAPMDEGTPLKPKWGFVANWADPATSPAPRLELMLDTRRPPSLLEPWALVPVFLLHLRSYEHMGTAEISCTSGCSCGSLVVDANITERVSQTYLARINVTQSDRCAVRVTVLAATSSGGRKFKVSGVVVSETGGETTVLDSMSDSSGYFIVGRFHTGDLSMAEYGRNETGGGPRASPG